MSAIGTAVHRYVSCWTGNKAIPSLHLFDGSVPTLVFTEAPHAPLPNVEYLPVSDYRRNIPRTHGNAVYTRITILLVEGGSQTLQSFIDAGLWDEKSLWKKLRTFFIPASKHPKSVTDIHLQQSILSAGVFAIIRPQETVNSLISGLFIEKKGILSIIL